MSRCYRPHCCAFAGLCGTGCRCCALLAALLAAFFSLGSRLRKERGIALKTCERVGAVVQDKKKGSMTPLLWTPDPLKRLYFTKYYTAVTHTRYFVS